MSSSWWRPRTARVQIYSHFGEPSPGALARDLMAPELWNGAAKAPGTRGGVQRVWLENFTEPEADRLAAGKHPALGPGWKRDALDNDPADWESFPGADEARHIADTLALYEAELANLQLQQQISAEETRRMAELEELIEGLQALGVLKAVPGTGNFGTDANAIYRALNAPNFEFRYRSKFILEQGRPFTLWLRRFTPTEGQINHFLQIAIGRTIRILLEKDRATLYKKNDRRNEREWQSKDARRQTLIQKRYGTRQQHEQIAAWRDAIEQIKAEYKGSSPTDSQKAQIAALQRRIKTLQDSFDLTNAEKEELEELEKFLFVQVETIDLNETSDSLIGVPFSLTFFDLGFGIMQIVCDIGRNRWIYQDKEILKSQKWQWLWGTPANRRAPDYDSGQRLEISGNGGALLWRFGYVKVNKFDLLLSAPVNLERADIDTAEGITVNGQWTPNLPAGNEVQFILQPVAGRAGWYQMGVRFITDGKAYPIVTRASILLPAGTRPVQTLLWDSAAPGACGGVELSPKYDDKRGVIWGVTVHAPVGLPDRLYEKCATISAVDDSTLEERTLMMLGSIAEQTHTHAVDVVPHTETVALQTYGEVNFSVAGKLRIARHKRFPADFTFDGMRENDVIRAALQAAGYSTAELSPIVAGEGEILPGAAPGEAPVLKPDGDARILSWLEKEIIEELGGGKQLFEGADGKIYYLDPAQRVYPDVYENALDAAAGSRLQYFAEGGRELERTWNTDDYFTQFRVEGSVNPDSKKPYTATHEIREAVETAFITDPRHIGYHKPKETLRDDKLNSQGAVERALATLVKKHGYPRPQWRIIVPANDDVLSGDRVTIGAADYTLLNIPDAKFENDTMQFALEEVIGNA
jgi:hypothetical protein